METLDNGGFATYSSDSAFAELFDDPRALHLDELGHVEENDV